MKIDFHSSFKKAYKNRISFNKKLAVQTEKRIILFKSNPNDPILKDHSLLGAKKGLRAFSISGNIRIVYMPVSEQKIIFVDIGSHNQVY